MESTEKGASEIAAPERRTSTRVIGIPEGLRRNTGQKQDYTG